MKTLKDHPVIPFMEHRTTRVYGADGRVVVLKTTRGPGGMMQCRADARICRQWLRANLPHRTYLELVRMIDLHDVPNLPEV